MKIPPVIVHPAGGDRRHCVTAEDVQIVLGRLPSELWARLRRVHLNDQGRGKYRLGYVTPSRRELALCAIPPRLGFTDFLTRRQSPTTFGAIRGRQWPDVAARRFMLYHVLLHELGHVQEVRPRSSSIRRRFADETKAEEFADRWRKKLWSSHFNHDDPVHNRPAERHI